MTTHDARAFSQWYADMARVDVKDRLWTRALGLPDEVLSTSVVTGTALDEIEGLLGLGPSDVLVDLACGRAGYGLELVARCGGRLLAVDVAGPAIAQGTELARRRRLSARADLRVADMAETGLPGGVATALVCLDALQFAGDVGAVLAEARRLLAPRSQIALTGWQARDLHAAGVSASVRRLRFGDALRAAGFVDVSVVERGDWAAQERTAWERVLAEPRTADPALRALQDEARRVLAKEARLVRVLARARTPGDHRL